MTGIRKILSQIKQLKRETASRKEIEMIFTETKSLGFPSYSAVRLIQAHLLFRIKSRPTLGFEGWIFSDEDLKKHESGKMHGEEITIGKNNENTIKSSGNNTDSSIVSEDNSHNSSGKSETLKDSLNNRKTKRIFYSLLVVILLFVFLVYLVRSNSHVTPSSRFGVLLGNIFGINYPPDIPTLISPNSGSNDVPITTQLNWTCRDPEGDPMTFDVYLWENGLPVNLVSSGQREQYLTQAGLKNGVSYQWKVVAMDKHGNIRNGMVWSFNTIRPPNRPPELPYMPKPSDEENIISVSPALSWNCNDPDGDGMTFDVYFGTTNPPSELISSGQTEQKRPLIGLTNSTTYYWRVDARDDHGHSTTGSVWSFTTAHLFGIYENTINDDSGYPIQYQSRITDASTCTLTANACNKCIVALINDSELPQWWNKWQEYISRNITTPYTFSAIVPGKYTLIIYDQSGNINPGSDGIIINSIDIKPGNDLIFNFRKEDFRYSHCLSCPWLYVFNGNEYVKYCEILRDVIGRENERQDSILIDEPFISDNILRLRLSEEKDEITYLSQLFIVRNGVICQPLIKGNKNKILKLDGNKLVMRKGDIINLEFDMKKFPDVTGPLIFKAAGYYDPDPERMRSQIRHPVRK